MTQLGMQVYATYKSSAGEKRNYLYIETQNPTGV